MREQVVLSTIMLILGLCTFMREYFVAIDGELPYVQTVVSRLEENTDPLAQTPRQLVAKSSLLPSPRESLAPGAGAAGALVPAVRTEANRAAPDLFGAHPITLEESVSPLDLNLFKLTTLAGVQIRWTDNLSRHMLLSNQGPEKRYIELFALPCALQNGPVKVLRSLIGISPELQDEICQSYALLFNSRQASKLSVHWYADKIIGLWIWCWCLNCSSVRLRERELRQIKKSTSGHLVHDPELETLARSIINEDEAWERASFKNLWPRIVALDRCLQEAKPWNFWILLRDRRNTAQYWTFL